MYDVPPSGTIYPYTKGWCYVIGLLAAAEELPMAPSSDPRMVRLASERGDHQRFSQLVGERQKGYNAARAMRKELELSERPVRYDLPLKPEKPAFSLRTLRRPPKPTGRPSAT